METSDTNNCVVITTTNSYQASLWRILRVTIMIGLKMNKHAILPDIFLFVKLSFNLTGWFGNGKTNKYQSKSINQGNKWATSNVKEEM